MMITGYDYGYIQSFLEDKGYRARLGSFYKENSRVRFITNLEDYQIIDMVIENHDGDSWIIRVQSPIENLKQTMSILYKHIVFEDSRFEKFYDNEGGI